jgi:hypothetical protein
MNIVYSDHSRDLITFYDIIEQDGIYKVYKKNTHHDFVEMVYTDTLENCVTYITNKILE